MLKKRITLIFLAVLSFFVFTFGGCAGAKTEYTLTDAASQRRLSIYMPSRKAEPNGGVTSSGLLGTKGAESEIAKLYDGDVSTLPSFDNDTDVTLDMGRVIMLTGIRYYASSTDNGENCLGTRFYASKDNKTYTELAVAEGNDVPENTWKEINFSGYGEYRYFKVSLPKNSNISEIEWIETSGLVKSKQAGGKTEVKLSLCGYNEGNELPVTILACVFNKDGVMKQGKVFKQTFAQKSSTDFELVLDSVNDEAGDSYRVAIFDKKGSSPIPSPLVFRVNDASSSFSVASVFGSNMMLQADEPLTVWGKAPKHATVEVTLKNSLGGEVVKKATVGKNSDWEVNMGSFSSGGNYTMLIKADGKSVEYKNITFGDVWICTGQSNMDYYMMAGNETAKELKNAADIKNSNIRLYNLWSKGTDGAAMPLDNPPSEGVSWHEADKDTIAYCSAVGYYFAAKIQAETNEPVGIINVAVGDTEINRWVKNGTSKCLFTSTSGDLYNNRIYPFEKLKIKGIILYQGEADQYRTHMSAEEYGDALACLIDAYRSKWGKSLPFYWAQLTRYKVDESLVRQGQFEALDKVTVKENTGMVALTDIFGNYKGGTGSCREDIHPWDKKTVGERFAAYALRDCYGTDVSVCGPIYKSSETDGEKLILTFDCTGVLRVMPYERYADKVTVDKIKKNKIDTNKIYEFEIAGEDGKFVTASAKIEGNKVILTNSSVKNPVYARYAWGAYPEMPNLTDDTGLPTAVFTTER